LISTQIKRNQKGGHTADYTVKCALVKQGFAHCRSRWSELE